MMAHAIMNAEYEFYINEDVKRAISILSESLRINSRNVFAFRALTEILKSLNMHYELVELNEKFPDLNGHD